jgi:hypothetical protein
MRLDMSAISIEYSIYLGQRKHSDGKVITEGSVRTMRTWGYQESSRVKAINGSDVS